jgi:sRNA-binding protein
MGRSPELDDRKLNAALSVYTRRVMYLRSLVTGAARVDLDGNPAGEVAATSPAAKVSTLKKRPVLRLPAFRQKCG